MSNKKINPPPYTTPPQKPLPHPPTNVPPPLVSPPPLPNAASLPRTSTPHTPLSKRSSMDLTSRSAPQSDLIHKANELSTIIQNTELSLDEQLFQLANILSPSNDIESPTPSLEILTQLPPDDDLLSSAQTFLESINSATSQEFLNELKNSKHIPWKTIKSFLSKVRQAADAYEQTIRSQFLAAAQQFDSNNLNPLLEATHDYKLFTELSSPTAHQSTHSIKKNIANELLPTLHQLLVNLNPNPPESLITAAPVEIQVSDHRGNQKTTRFDPGTALIEECDAQLAKLQNNTQANATQIQLYQNLKSIATYCHNVNKSQKKPTHKIPWTKDLQNLLLEVKNLLTGKAFSPAHSNFPLTIHPSDRPLIKFLKGTALALLSVAILLIAAITFLVIVPDLPLLALAITGMILNAVPGGFPLFLTFLIIFAVTFAKLLGSLTISGIFLSNSDPDLPISKDHGTHDNYIKNIILPNKERYNHFLQLYNTTQDPAQKILIADQLNKIKKNVQQYVGRYHLKNTTNLTPTEKAFLATVDYNQWPTPHLSTTVTIPSFAINNSRLTDKAAQLLALKQEYQTLYEAYQKNTPLKPLFPQALLEKSTTAQELYQSIINDLPPQTKQTHQATLNDLNPTNWPSSPELNSITLDTSYQSLFSQSDYMPSLLNTLVQAKSLFDSLKTTLSSTPPPSPQEQNLIKATLAEIKFEATQDHRSLMWRQHQRSSDLSILMNTDAFIADFHSKYPKAKELDPSTWKI